MHVFDLVLSGLDPIFTKVADAQLMQYAHFFNGNGLCDSDELYRIWRTGRPYSSFSNTIENPP